jgi:hypothetical protein
VINGLECGAALFAGLTITFNAAAQGIDRFPELYSQPVEEYLKNENLSLDASEMKESYEVRVFNDSILADFAISAKITNLFLKASRKQSGKKNLFTAAYSMLRLPGTIIRQCLNSCGFNAFQTRNAGFVITQDKTRFVLINPKNLIDDFKQLIPISLREEEAIAHYVKMHELRHSAQEENQTGLPEEELLEKALAFETDADLFAIKKTEKAFPDIDIISLVKVNLLGVILKEDYSHATTLSILAMQKGNAGPAAKDVISANRNIVEAGIPMKKIFFDIASCYANENIGFLRKDGLERSLVKSFVETCQFIERRREEGPFATYKTYGSWEEMLETSMKAKTEVPVPPATFETLQPN